MTLKELIEIFRAFRGGVPLGDVALMKFAAMKKTSPALAAKLQSVAGYAPAVAVETLLQLPDDSFGHAYARFLRDNNLQHFNLNPDLVERYRDNPYAVRYTVTHDLHHVLCGFDAGMAGEQGVVGFTVGQGIAPTGPVGMWFSRLLSPLLSPSQASQTRHNYNLGVRMGQAATLLIAAPLESWFERPLQEVRAELGIERRDVDAVRASGTAWLSNVLYNNRSTPPLAEAEPHHSP